MKLKYGTVYKKEKKTYFCFVSFIVQQFQCLQEGNIQTFVKSYYNFTFKPIYNLFCFYHYIMLHHLEMVYHIQHHEHVMNKEYK